MLSVRTDGAFTVTVLTEDGTITLTADRTEPLPLRLEDTATGDGPTWPESGRAALAWLAAAAERRHIPPVNPTGEAATADEEDVPRSSAGEGGLRIVQHGHTTLDLVLDVRWRVRLQVTAGAGRIRLALLDRTDARPDEDRRPAVWSATDGATLLGAIRAVAHLRGIVPGRDGQD